MHDERERAVQRLSEHFAADHLTMAELEHRMEQVYAAATPAALSALLADLPSLNGTPLVHHDRMQSTMVIRTAFGGIERTGAMAIPAKVDARAVFGSIELDLRDATFGAFTVIDAHATFGSVEVILPLGVRVENDGGALMGSYSSEVTPGNTPMVGTAPVVRFTGKAIFGSVEIRAVPTRRGRD